MRPYETAPNVRRTILIVDDEERNRALLRAYLEPRYVVQEASGGAAALSLLERTQVDLVLLDVMMPEVNGFVVCHEIKTRNAGGYLPVILLTALTDQEDRNAGLSCGADDYLTKPIDRHELLLRVSAFLRIREQDAQIRRQLDDLRRLQDFKDDLVSLVVHDLRNLLLGVDGYLHLLRRRLEEAEGRSLVSFADNALEGVSRLRRLVEDLLEIRRLEEGELTIKREPAAVGSILTEATAMLSGIAAENGVSLHHEHEGAQIVAVDRRFVQRAVENLLSNALKYSSAGSAVDVVGRTYNDEIEIAVADRGPGVPDGYKQTIFERFGSAEPKFGSIRRGYGLGLYFVKLVAQAHGGDISVEDRDGGGAVFRLVLSADGMGEAASGRDTRFDGH